MNTCVNSEYFPSKIIFRVSALLFRKIFVYQEGENNRRLEKIS